MLHMLRKSFQFKSICDSTGTQYTWNPVLLRAEWFKNGNLHTHEYSLATAANFLESRKWLPVQQTGLEIGYLCKMANGNCIYEVDGKLLITADHFNFVDAGDYNKTIERRKAIVDVSKDLGVTYSVAERIVLKGYTKQ